MPRRWLAPALVHVLTASGILCALAAYLALVRGDLRTTFLWLALALVIDTIDGPLARRVDVATQLPRFSGERLDLIVDYVTYVFIPALILLQTVMADDWVGRLVVGAMVLVSLYHFADRESKTGDHYFVGFPVVWNLVVFYLLAFEAGRTVAMAVVSGLSLATFLPLKWVHPMRVKHLRPLTQFIVAAWALAAMATILADLRANGLQKAVLVMAALYIAGVSLLRSLHGPTCRKDSESV